MTGYDRIVTPTRVRAILAGVVLLVAGAAAGQAPAAANNAAAAKPWRTPWGDPDVQGSWSNATTTPLERPAKYAGREFLTPQERASQDLDTEIGWDTRADPGTAQDVAGAYTRRPHAGLNPGGPEAEKPAQRMPPDRRPVLWPRRPRFLYGLCHPQPLPRLSSGYDNNLEIVQTP